MEEKDAVRIRPAAPADAGALLAIYAPYVNETAITFEYEVPGAAEFAGRIENTLKKYPYLVAERGGEPLGYAYAGAFKDRAAYDWAVETSVYIRRDARHLGLGRALYAALETALAAQGILNLNACIAVPPTGEDEYLSGDSVAFHERLGYALVGQFHACGYKFGRWYDMVWMEKFLGAHAADQPPVRPFPEVRPALYGE